LLLPPEVRHRALRWKWWAATALGVAVALLVIIAPWRSKPAPFRTAPLERRSVTRVVEASGQVDVLTRTEVPAPAAGTLVESLVRSGAQVTEGQPLARLDTRATTIASQSAQAAERSALSRAAEARTALNAAKDVLNRSERLAERGLASESELNAARADVQRAGAALSAARAEHEVATSDLAAAKLQQSLRTLSAPTSGVVLSAPDSLGMIAAPESGALFVIGSPLETMRVDAWISESEVGVVSAGQAGTFTVPAFSERHFDARVESVGVDATRTGASVRYRVRLIAPNTDRRLLPGMTATVRIEVGRVEGVLAVPEAALRFAPPDAGDAAPRSRVFRLSNGELQPVSVATGLSDGTFTELHPKPPGALSVGDPIVIGRALDGEPDAHGPGITLGRR
jgi:HlyD family secretion protein